MTTKYETWVDEVNSKCRFYLFWERSNAGYKINDICVSVTTVINTMLKKSSLGHAAKNARSELVGKCHRNRHAGTYFDGAIFAWRYYWI